MSSRAEVAIVGYAARLPGARTTDAFWSLLRDSRCSVGTISADRFPTEAYYHPSPNQPGKSYTFAAGLIDDVWGFDAGAFGMSPREVKQVDPQQRHLLEVTHDALAHAGIKPAALSGSHTGVYIGASSVDHGARFFADPSAADVHMMTGNTLSVISNRLSYNFNLHGPSFTVDTACSSSLVALSLAVDAIQQGKVDTAIVGGVNLLLSPFSFIGFSRASMLSPTGLCRPFDAAADGYVRAEGVIVFVLRSMAAARHDRNQVHAAILGAGIGQDGRTTGLSLPSADAQRTILEQVYSEAGVAAEDLSFVEAHGTGTRVGDPIEADALGKALGQKRTQPLPIGSVKSNIGHLEPASGLAGVLKTVLALTKGVVPATLHQQVPNADIPFDELNLRVLDRAWRLPERRAPHLAGVNSFGFGGTNAHVILRGEEAVVSILNGRKGASLPPLVLSAHSSEALAAVASTYAEHWPGDQRLVPDFVGAAAHQRDRLTSRAIFRADSAEALKLEVDRFARGDASPNTQSGLALGHDLPVAFVFSGNGSQWAGMGRDAWHADGRFRDALRDVDEHFLKKAKWSLVDTLFEDDLGPKLRCATYAQPLILALQVATVRALEELGLSPSAVLGHSVGEIAAAWAAGCLSLDQALDIVIARSRHQEQTRGKGAMAALMLGERDARRFIEGARVSAVAVAAINSGRSVTLSGPSDEIDRVVAAAAELRVSARRLDLDYPFHSALVDPVRGPLMRELAGLRPRQSRKHFISTVTGTALDGPELGSDHWWRNVRDPVQFAAGLGCLLKDGFRVFVEVGAKPILGSYIRDILREADIRGTSVETLTESAVAKANAPLERTVSQVVVAGGQVDDARFFGSPPIVAVTLPAYPWRHSQFKVRPTFEAGAAFTAIRHPLLGRRPYQDSLEWYSTVDPVLFPWIADHKVAGMPVFPAAAYVEALLAVAREIHPGGGIELREMDIVHPLVFDGYTTFETLLRVSPEAGVTEFLSRPRDGSADWVMNARAIVARLPTIDEHLPQPAGVGNVLVPKAKVYEVSRKLGFAYGSSFQRIHHVSFPEPKRAIAALQQSPALFADAIIDLTALDAAFHALFASEEAGVADMPMKQMLPVRFARVRVFAAGCPATQAVARTIRQSLSSIVTDIELRDDTGRVLVLAEAVRLIEAPSATAVDSHTLTYKSTTWALDRAGKPSKLFLRADAVGAGDSPRLEHAEELGEALLLIEAGCLRATWSAFADGRSVDAFTEEAPAEESAPEWQDYLRSALLWHLETKHLAKEQEGSLVIAETCSLPSVGSVVRSLLSRHPTMAAEAASLSRLNDILHRFVAGDASVHAELHSSHWRQLSVASSQISQLRQTVADALLWALDRRDKARLIRLLLVGADHAIELVEQIKGRPGIDIVITDLDADRLEQASAALGDDASQVRSVPWSELASWPAATFDMAAAVDALSEIAAASTGLERLHRLLRPDAPLIAGEPAPSLLWDIVRGIRGTWWARSASSSFPVGALLTPREWVDELTTSGFAQVEGRELLGDGSIGVVIHCKAGIAGLLEGPYIGPPVFSWEGNATANSQLLRSLMADGGAGEPNDEPAVHANRPGESDIVWIVDLPASRTDSSAALERHLLRLAERCRAAAATAVARLWVLIDFGMPEDIGACVAHPLWCALSAALRVVQNENPTIELRCVGLAGTAGSRSLEATAEEMLAPTDEREILFLDGERRVVRIERGASHTQAQSLGAAAPNLKLASRSGTNRSGLMWKDAPRQPPEANEIEIEVAATGLNFRDVMWNLGLLPEEALEDGYAGAALGMECAGVVSAVGHGVQEFKVGDRVIAFVSGGFATHVVAPAFAVCPVPNGLTLEAAASLPVAFLTAYYSLVHLAGLKRGEKVLIHGGAGAVGLAALQVARYCGAEVIATAGTEEKRALLRDLGASVVLNSRTLSFADDVRVNTDGRGVDVVLNSLAGEAMIRSMDCLRPFGRFIELGKRDFYANTHLGLRPLRRNLTYFGVDVDQLIVEHRELTQQVLKELLALFANHEFTSLPYQVYSGERIADAFRRMQRAGHIGKLVVRPARQPTDTVRRKGVFPVDTGATHVVIGGTSGFGLATAEWLAARGARHLALASRSGVLSDAARTQVDALRTSGIEVEVATLDVADTIATETFLKRLQAQRRVGGIVHAAMVLDDRLIDGMDREAIARVLHPKVDGALALEAAAGTLCLDYLLLYSSATTLLGNPGQYNYVAANAFMEGLAQRAWGKGLPAIAVSWGGIEDTGFLARNIGTNTVLKKRFASSLLATRSALDALDLAFDDEGKPASAVLVIAQIDWAMARRELAVLRSPLFAAVVPAAGARAPADASVTLEKLRAMSLVDATAALLDIIVDEIAQVLRLPAKEVDRYRPLAEIGMDSLMMLELRATVEAALHVELPMMSLANGITPADVARRIAPIVLGEHDHQEVLAGNLMALSTSHLAADTEASTTEEQLAAARAVLARSRTMDGPL
ncbi:MAG: beta-ketoacyl synthase [Xanthobacteraceae bacterium]|nr:MAG: beta-ketoacyl synthase [Xanthobacteraceae bacterium]